MSDKDYAKIHQEEFHDHLAHAGWRHGAEYDVDRKEHPWMMPWIQMSAEEQEKFIAEYEGIVSHREPPADPPKEEAPKTEMKAEEPKLEAPKEEAPKAEAKSEEQPAAKADEPPPAA